LLRHISEEAYIFNERKTLNYIALNPELFIIISAHLVITRSC